MSSKELLTQPGPCDHLVQFCGDERALAQNVALYLREGAERGDGMIVIATPSHQRLFTELLAQAGVNAEDLVKKDRLLFFDAEKTLASFTENDDPDWQRFDQVVGSLVRDFRARLGGAGLRAYGEMVDLLWKAGKLSAATKLETFWNRLLEECRFALFCAYTVDLLGQKVSVSAVQEIMTTHSHLLPVRSNGELDRAVARAMREVVGEKGVAAIMPLIRANVISGVTLPEAERTVLWLRKNVPPYAAEVLMKARGYYEEECARAGRKGSH